MHWAISGLDSLPISVGAANSQRHRDLLLKRKVDPGAKPAEHGLVFVCFVPAARIPEGFQAGAIDFASSLFGWVIYKCVNNLAYVGAGVLTLITIGMMFWNRKLIVADEKKSNGQQD